MLLNAESTPKKKRASSVVMMMTITPVINVSRRVGHTIFALSDLTCRRNSPGLTLATNSTFEK